MSNTKESQKNDSEATLPTKEEIIKFYTEQLEVLELQDRYEQAKRNIAVNKAEGLQANLAYMDMTQQLKKNSGVPTPNVGGTDENK